MKTADADPFELICNATAIRTASRRVTQFYDRTLEPCGLRSTQLAILNRLVDAAEPMTIGELASALVIDRSALGHTIRPLVRDGYIRLTTCDSDKRRSRITLTRRGHTKWRAARQLWLDAQTRFESSIGAKNAARLRTLLSSIARSDDLTVGDDT